MMMVMIMVIIQFNSQQPNGQLQKQHNIEAQINKRQSRGDICTKQQIHTNKTLNQQNKNKMVGKIILKY